MLAVVNMLAKNEDDDESSNDMDVDEENQLSLGDCDGGDEDEKYQQLANLGDDMDQEWEEQMSSVPWMNVIPKRMFSGP